MDLVIIATIFGTSFASVGLMETITHAWRHGTLSRGECSGKAPSSEEGKHDESRAADNMACDDRLRIKVSSHFLLQCWKHLVSVPEEQLVPVSGMLNERGVLEVGSFAPVRYSKASTGEVDADPISSLASLVEMDKYGHLLTGVFHSHPFNGSEGTRPSRKDLDAQKRYQALGYQAVSGIFSRDGYIRFFTVEEMDFEIRIVGKGIEEVGTNVYKLAV